MKNRLNSTLPKTHFFVSKGVYFNSKPNKKNFLGKNLKTVFILIFFLTLSGKGYAQLSESFDSGIPASWTLFGNGIGTSSWQTTTDGYSGTNGVFINPSADNIGDQNTAQYFMVTPQITIPENGEIHFYTKQESAIDNGAEYQVRISTATQPDINGFNITLQSYTEVNLNNGLQTIYEKKVIEIPTSIPAGLNIYIAFVAVNTQNGNAPTGDAWYVDQVEVQEGCIEINDVDITVDNISVTGADINWTHPTATNFEIQILPTGGLPASSGIPVSGTNYTLTNLDPETEFDVYISAICDNSSTSEWSGPISFETLKLGLTCEEPIVLSDLSNTPYVLIDNLQNFEHPDPSAVSYPNQGANCIPGEESTNHLRGNKIFHTYTPTVDGLLTITLTTATQSGGGDNNCWNDRISLFVYDGCSNVGVNCTAGFAIEDAFEPKSINNLFVQQGQTYVIVVSSELTNNAGICFQLDISSPTCAPPADFTYNNLTENSVVFSWDNVGAFSDSWEYQVVPTASGEPTISGTATNTNTNVLINSGLTPATTYDLYVRSICGGSPGIWSTPYTFTTQCSVFDTPYFTDFTGANITPEPCWTSVDVNGDGNTWGYLGSQTYATIVTEPDGVSNDMIVSPQINFDGIQKRLRYKHRATQGISTYSVRLSTSGIGVNDFTTVLLPETQISNTGFLEIIVDIPESITGNVNIAWVVEPNTSETALRLSIDDVYIEDKPACPDPTNPFALNITTNSAWFAWTAGDTETQWQVAIQDLDSGLPTGDGVIANSNFPYAATGLESGYRYEYYVRAYCNEDEQSNWIGPVAFTTLCESYDTPFFESFNDDDPDTQKFCWEIVDQNSDEALWIMNENEPSLQNGGQYNDYLISPQINIDGIKLLKFKYRAQFSFFTGSPRFGLEVLMSTTNTNPFSFSVISPLEIFTNTEYQEKSIIIEGNGPIYIAFRVPPEFTGGSSILNIDDVSITDAPACPNPTDLMVNTTLTEGADLSWSAGFQETNWNIAVQPIGTGIPTTSGVSVTANSYTATGLTPDTEYEFYVMADCGGSTSEWVGPLTFKTLCTALTSPFTETFNSDSDSESCWIVINDNDDGETWELDSGSLTYEGDQAAAMFTGTNGNNEDWLISPTITITENQRLRYYYRVNDSFFTEDLEVLLSTNGIGLDQFTTVLYDSDDDPVLINNNEYLVKIINLPSGITGDINIAFHVPFFPSTGPYRGQTLVIDNVNIEDIPDCPEPTNIILNNLTDTEVQVAWDANGTETAWEISVQPAGTPAPIGDTDPSYIYNASINPFTVTGLTASTAYDIYVRAVCDGDTEGVWIGPSEVITKCSFENLCQYTFILNSNSNISAELEITQNNQVSQSLDFNGQVDEQYIVFLCAGVEFSLFFDSGTYAPQYSSYQFEILDYQGNSVYTSPLGLPPRSIVYTGFATCGNISCPQPTDLAVSDASVLSWTPGGSETQWEIAIQPIENGTIPQSGTIISTNSYIPTIADFNNPNAATYEYFIRAVCGTDDVSYWSGPFEFVRNDDISNAINIPINTDETCTTSLTEVSFTKATVSAETMTCEGVNQGDIWFEFTAESIAHVIEVSSFLPGPAGNFYQNNGDLPYPELTMTLYRDNSGVLEEIICSYDKILVAMYAAKLNVGDNYKLRLTLNSPDTNKHKFKICITTPLDPCSFNLAVNGNFEEPALEQLSGITTITTLEVVPGWRQNLDSNNAVFIWESLNAPGFQPYEGGQCIQLLSDQGTTIDPNDPNIKGLYRDFESSEITLFEFSFAHYKRFDGNTIQLFAGPPAGPYTLVNEHSGNTTAWEIVTGVYQVPDGQDVTRFIFRANGDDNIGNVLDAISITTINEIITPDHEVDCNNAMTTVEAEGFGTWIADTNNPSPISFADANSRITTVSGFVQPGIYSITWKSSHCEEVIELTYNGIGDLPTVETPIEYCLNDTAQPLSATATSTYSLIWYTQDVGGTGSTTPITPSTSSVGTTSYYVANRDNNGCEGPRAEISVTVNDTITPELTFSYPTICELATDNLAPTLNTGFTTGGTFTSSTLTIDALTGAINMTSATAGEHDVLYTYNGDTDTCTLSGTYTTTVEFTAASSPIVDFDYGNDSYCLLEGNSVLPNLASGFASGGEFNSTTIIVNATTGEVDLTSAPAGTYEIVYTLEQDVSNCIQTNTFTTSIEITATVVPVTTFTYPQDFYCTSNDNIVPELATGFTSGGLFSAESGLTINATTGEIDLLSSSTGNYTVNYEIVGDITNCTEASTSSFTISVLASSNPITTFNYGNDAFCLLSGNTTLPNLSNEFTTGGVFSSTTLTVNETTGAIDLTSASAGVHDIVYTFNGDATNCIEEGAFTTSIEVSQLTTPTTSFMYEEATFCANSINVLPTLDSGFTSGGTFSAQSGLSINPTTGEINSSSSATGNYIISYEVVEDITNCIEASVSSYTITILDSIEVMIDGECNDSEYVLTAVPVNNSYNPDEVTYTWKDNNGNVIGFNTNVFNVTQYADQNQNVTIPTQFSVTVDYGDCFATATFSPERLACRDIPRGISPDGNGKNDSFDLSGYGVNNLQIFNRYGTVVFSYKGVYTNQWHGQSKDGKELPDGTYFYSILKQDGTNETGWIYINRDH